MALQKRRCFSRVWKGKMDPEWKTPIDLCQELCVSGWREARVFVTRMWQRETRGLDDPI